MTQLDTSGWVLTDIAGEHIYNIDSNTFTPVKDYDTRTFHSLDFRKADAIICENELKGCHLKREHYEEVFSQAQLRDIELQCNECCTYTPVHKGRHDKDYGRVCQPCYEEIQNENENENENKRDTANPSN